jgi:1,4-alpha-glucan branching enzyme
MLYKMPGDEWQKFANLRALYAYMWTHPGGRLLFMGNEFGQTAEWNYRSELDWHLLQFPLHEGLQHCIRDLNRILKKSPALFCNQFKTAGFEWVDLQHRKECVMVYKRIGNKRSDDLLIILNLTPVPRIDWKIDITDKIFKKEIFNSDHESYGGTGTVFNPEIRVEIVNKKEKKYQLIVNLPPLAALILK